MKKKIAITFFLFCINLISFSQDFTYKFCLSQKDAVQMALTFTVCNNTTTALTTFDFVFNWPGVSNVTVDNGLAVIQNGNGGVVEFQQLNGSKLNPGCGNTFTVRMNYVFGMFPPTIGILNGDTIKGITCYVPPSFENFDCKRTLSDVCFIKTNPEIKIGEGTVRSWNSTLDVYIPTNRKNWAIGMAVAHTLFTNLIGVDCISPNEYFATTVQETNCGCDGTVTPPAWVTNIYPVDPLVYCSDYTHGVAVGYFQEEYGTGWMELQQDIPCFIPTINFDTCVVGKRFETQTLAKAYHDYNNIAYWQYIKCWDPIGFLKNAKDPYAGDKMISLAYNRGMNSGVIATLLTTDRAAAIAAPNILQYLNPPGVGWVYAEQISRVAAVLDNNFSAVSVADAATNGVTFPGVHKFHDFYDTLITWTDVSNYLDAIYPMYAGVGVNLATFKNTIQKVFNGINGGNSISFRYQMAPVVDAIVLNLPAFNPMPGLGAAYVNSGGSSCNFPTASMLKSDTVCPGVPLTLTVKLTGVMPWTFSYMDPKGNVITLNNITTSPYTFTVADTGTYHLISVTDNSGQQGQAICAPVIKAYSINASTADLLANSVNCGPKGLEIKFKGSGPWDIEYSKNGVPQTPINGITQNPYILIAPPAPLGIYVLTRLKANGCDISLKDSAVVDTVKGLTMNVNGNTSICSGESTTLSVHGANTYTWANGLGTDSVVIISPSTTSTYTVYGTSGPGCTGSKIISVTVNQKPSILLSPDTTICLFSGVNLNASGGTTYTWAPATGLNTTTGASVIASPTSAITYSITATGAGGCIAKDTVHVGVIPCGITVHTDGGKVCQGTCFNLTAKGTGGSSPYIYSWSSGQSTQMISVCPTITTTYSISITDKNGLTAVDTAMVVVNPIVTANVSSSNILCNGTKSGTASVVPITGTSPYIYVWSPAGGNSSTATGLSAGNYSVTITDAMGCSYSSTVSITEPAAMVITTSSTQSSCVKKDGTATVNVSNGITPYTYQWNNGQSTSSASGLGGGTYSVLITDGNGCTQTKTVTVAQMSGPTITTNASADVITPGSNTTLTATGGGIYLWSPSTGLSCSTCANPTATPDQTTNYCVVVTDANSCTAKSCLTITVQEPCGTVYVPNAFSPNNDFENDMECVMGGCIKSMYFAIYNRWGEKVFESTNQKTCWDGTYKNKLQDAAVYGYYLSVKYTDGKQITKKGNISLIR